MRKSIAIFGVSCLLTAYCLLPTSTFAADKTAKLEDENKVLKQKIARLEKMISQPTSTLDKGTQLPDGKAGKDTWIQGNLYPDGDAGVKDVRKGKTFYSNSWEQKTGDTLLPIEGGLIKTGQTTPYVNYDDGWYKKGLAFDFTDNLDGTITDNNTGLMWAKDGTGVGCMGGATFTWATAIDTCNNLTCATYTDWRLPNVRELQSIADYGRDNPAIDPIFINTQSNNYWSSTTYHNITSYAWLVTFGSGTVYSSRKTNGYYVRAVRGSQ